ncbi:hypothetical protein N7470_004102 [Penicillium chermesinum]|nr:hypothetical protein N7470_004102 [Penicillium chermesinum]
MARPLARGCHWTPALPADDGTFTGRPMRGRRPGIKGGGPFPSPNPKAQRAGHYLSPGQKAMRVFKGAGASVYFVVTGSESPAQWERVCGSQNPISTLEYLRPETTAPKFSQRRH